jgi:HK97 family phage major capsid protein
MAIKDILEANEGGKPARISREEFITAAKANAEANDQDSFAGSIYDQMTAMEDGIRAAAIETLGFAHDEEVTVARGGAKLTAKEKKFWTAQIEAGKNRSRGAITAALTNVETVMPETIFDRVFEDLTQNFPLLNAISFSNTAALMEWYMASSGGDAVWGELTAPIGPELTGDFTKTTLELKKLSARMVIPSAYLDLGPVWLDRFVRTIMPNKLAKALEAAIVDGDGNGKPLGMTRALTGDTGGVFPRKTPVAVTALDPATIGGILAKVSQTPNGNTRDVPRLLMVCNPADYYTKVYPSVTPRASDGSWRENTFPYPMTVVTSGSLAAGQMVLGLASKYFCGLGTGKGGRLEYDDSVGFFEHTRGYRIFLYGNGRAEDENAFVLCDISGLTPAVLDVRVTSAVPEV